MNASPNAAGGRLFASVRDALARALAAWHPSDESALVTVRVWRRAWPTADWTSFLARAVAPRLASALRERVDDVRSLSAHSARMGALDNNSAVLWAARWVDILPGGAGGLLDSLFAGEFWPRWLDTLVRALGLDEGGRLGTGVDLGDAADWYETWLAALPAAVLALPSASRARRAALTVIDSAASLSERGADADEAACAAAVECATVVRRSVGLPASSSFARARDAAASMQRFAASSVGRHSAIATAAPSLASPSGHSELPVGASTVTLSFRDVVEETAAAKGVAFVPHPRRAPVDGALVFLLGKTPVYISGGVLFADTSGRGEYQPVSIDQLLG